MYGWIQFFFFTLCTPTCLLCVVCVWVHMVRAHAHACVWKPAAESSIFLHHSPFYVLTVLSLNLELTNSTRLAGQWVSEINPSLFPFCPDLGLWMHWLCMGTESSTWFYCLHSRYLTAWTFFPMLVFTFYKDILTAPHRGLNRELIRRVLS